MMITTEIVTSEKQKNTSFSIQYMLLSIQAEPIKMDPQRHHAIMHVDHAEGSQADRRIGLRLRSLHQTTSHIRGLKGKQRKSVAPNQSNILCHHCIHAVCQLSPHLPPSTPCWSAEATATLSPAWSGDQKIFGPQVLLLNRIGIYIRKHADCSLFEMQAEKLVPAMIS